MYVCLCFFFLSKKGLPFALASIWSISCSQGLKREREREQMISPLSLSFFFLIFNFNFFFFFLGRQIGRWKEEEQVRSRVFWKSQACCSVGGRSRDGARSD